MSSLIVEVCEIKDIQPHPNADRLEIATVKGWNCIVQKGAYWKGEYCVFFPPDSVLPQALIEKYDLEFLKKGGRVGTLKLRGYISQGLILPVDCVPSKYTDRKDWGEGFNVAEILGITKYEAPQKHIQMAGKSTSRRVQNPHFSKYTDIENIKNFPDVFKEGDIVVITEKIHGSNIRFGWLPIEINWRGGNVLSIARSLFRKYILRETHEFVYGSHNVQLHFDSDKGFYDENIYAKVLKGVNIGLLPKDHIFYGEVYGKGVQDLEYGCDDLKMSVFDVKDISRGYLNFWGAFELCEGLGLSFVPPLYKGWFDLNELKKATEGNSLICDDQIREGCVVRLMLEANHPRIGRQILKSINPEYLARKNRTEYH